MDNKALTHEQMDAELATDMSALIVGTPGEQGAPHVWKRGRWAAFAVILLVLAAAIIGFAADNAYGPLSSMLLKASIQKKDAQPQTALESMIWLRRPGYDCSGMDSNTGVAGKSPIEGKGKLTRHQCMGECEREPLCKAIMVPPGLWASAGQCFLLEDLKLSECKRPIRSQDREYDTWEHSQREPEPPRGVWESFKKDTACRLNVNDTTEDGNGTAFVYGASNIDACKGLCGLVGDLCYGIEYEPSVQRCEIWTQPIDWIVPVAGYECIEFKPAGFGFPTLV